MATWVSRVRHYDSVCVTSFVIVTADFARQQGAVPGAKNVG